MDSVTKLTNAILNTWQLNNQITVFLIENLPEEKWPKAIIRVLEKYPEVKVVIPGHGNYGDATLLRHTIDLFQE